MNEGHRTVRRALRLLALGLLLAAGPLGAQDVEEILSYDVEVDIQRDSRLVVTELIRVRALGQEIRRGIYRDFPTSFPRSSGFGRIEAPFRLLDVLKDEAPEPHELESIGGSFGRGGIRIRIGDADVYLDDGVYTYTIRYETERWVVFGDEADQLYWNVTGNGWGFPIRSASARIRVDGSAIEPSLESWTGPEGATERNVEQSWDRANGAAVFSTTTSLAPREGLTVRVTFDKGVLTPPPAERQAQWFWLDWGGYIDSGMVVLAIVMVYLLMWMQVGRDPEKSPNVVRYDPPEGFSPAALGYLQERGYDNRQLAAAVVSMAVKGAILIEKTKKKWRLHKIDDTVDLTPEEQKVLSELLGKQSQLTVTQSEHAKLRKAIKGLKAKLGHQLEKHYFVHNRRWFMAGLALSIVGFLGIVWRARYGIEPGAWFIAIWLTGWTAGVSTMLWRAIQGVRSGLSGGGFGALAGGLFMTLFLLPFLGAELFVGGMFIQMVPTYLVLAAVAIAVTNVAFYHLLEAPTMKGRGVLDRLDGFRAFLTATDEDRLDRMTPPDKTPELFERFLPHAIALGLQNRWADQFAGVLTPEAIAASSTGMAWYDGGSGSLDASSFASSLGSSLSSTLSSSSSPPGGSGGSGGGGSSGGGGGGGGGGGW